MFVIQSLLNDRLPRPHCFLPVTGDADVGFILAIEAYQAVVLGMNPPSGRVEPGSATYYSLAARPLVEHAAAPRVRPFRPGAARRRRRRRSRRKLHWKVPASVTLAQWAVESAWGASMPPGQQQPVRHQGRGRPAGGGRRHARGRSAGRTSRSSAKFRKFENLAEAFDLHGKLLATNKVYAPAMALAADPDAFADALTGVYATDPKYGYTLKWVMQNYGFTQYNTAEVKP